MEEGGPIGLQRRAWAGVVDSGRMQKSQWRRQRDDPRGKRRALSLGNRVRCQPDKGKRGDSMNKHTIELVINLRDLGFSTDEALSLRRIQLTLDRWNELECGTGDDRVTISIERDEETEKPFLRRQFMGYGGQWKDIRTPCADREKGALKRLDKIMSAHPEFVAYHQGDCRGCALYIVRKADLNGQDINSCYTRGIAVCD